MSKGFVSPGGSLTIPGNDPATLSLPDTGDGAPVIITQGDGTFCDGPCDGTATEISEFAGYSDPNHPIVLELTYNVPGQPDEPHGRRDGLRLDDLQEQQPGHSRTSAARSVLHRPRRRGKAIPHPCVDARSITQPTPNTFVVTFKILYISGDPKFARR